MRWFGTLVTGLAVASASSVAHAHAPAQATGIFWSEGATGQSGLPSVWVRTNRGLIVGDGRGDFRLLCSEALRVSPSEIPALFVSGDRALIATYDAGLLANAPDLCAFAPVALPPGGGRVLDLGASADQTRLFALTAPTGTESAGVFASEDAGRTWQAGARMNAFGSSIRVAPSDPSRVYIAQQPLTGGANAVAELAVTEDGGHTFTTRAIDLQDDEVRAFVAAVGERDPELVFATTVRGNPLVEARLLVSRDAGRSFVTAFQAVGPLAVAIDPESSSVFVGGMDGVFRSRDDARSFAPLGQGISNVGCLAVHDGELFVCGVSDDQFGVFKSSDDGATFGPYLSFTSVREGVACESTSEVVTACAGSIEHWKSELPEQAGEVVPEPPPAVSHARRSEGCAFVRPAPSPGHWLAAWLVAAVLGARRRGTTTWGGWACRRERCLPRRRTLRGANEKDRDEPAAGPRTGRSKCGP